MSHGIRGTYGNASASLYVSPRIAALDAETNERLDRQLAAEDARPGYCVNGHNKDGRGRCKVCHREWMRAHRAGRWR